MWRTAFFLICALLGAFAVNEKLIYGFIKYGIQPEIIPFAPVEKLSVTFPSGAKAKLGNLLSYEKVRETPIVNYVTTEKAYYTLAAIDAGVTLRLDSNSKPYLSYLVMNIPDSDVPSGDVVYNYKLTLPKEYEFLGNVALARYVYLVYMQYRKFDKEEMEEIIRTIENRSDFPFADYLFQYNLTIPVYGNFFLSKYDENQPNIIIPDEPENSGEQTFDMPQSEKPESSSQESDSNDQNSKNKHYEFPEEDTYEFVESSE